MNANKKFQGLFVGLLVLGFFMGNTLCFSWIYFNGSTSGYNDGTPPGSISSLQSYYSMESMVMEGAGFYLQGKAYIQNLLNRIELQDLKGIDYDELSQLTRKALFNIIQARLTFVKLLKIAEATPYNQVVIEKLNRFDYESFANENNLNQSIIDSVKNYLQKGDITGTFKYNYESLKGIEILLLKIQLELNGKIVPDISLFWNLNELCAETTLFGSYTARIFNAIR